MRDTLRSSPRQTFVAYPAAIIAAELARRRIPRIWPWALVMAAGYGLYRYAGAYRSSIAGGHGMESTPDALVTGGPYAATRNPMYLGHIVFAAGLLGATRSPLALLALVERISRFRERVARDEPRLERLFGEAYHRYTERVPRWIPLGQGRSLRRHAAHIP